MFDNLLLSLQGVWSHKMRSFLTMLGIIIGIASIITIVATIKGTSEQIKENLVGSGTNAVTVNLHQEDNLLDFSFQDPPAGISPIPEEVRKQLLTIENSQSATLFTHRSYCEGVYHGNNSFSGALYGIDESYFSVYGWKLSYGRMFTEADHEGYRKVIILDSDAAASLFTGDDPINQTVEIQGVPFTVVGVVERSRRSDIEISTLQEYFTYASSSGGACFIPGETWPIVYRYDEPQSVGIRAESTDDMTTVGKKAADMLTSLCLSGVDGKYSYRANDLNEQAEQLQSLANSSNRQLLWIAGISLLVGGIGVMNIMLVTVTERTQEIGLKIAIGARKRRILWQFLTEAAVLTGIGGVLGVLAGFVVSRVITSVMGTPTVISIPAILVSVLFSTLVGVLFGMLPAVKASNLNPIDALRRE